MGVGFGDHTPQLLLDTLSIILVYILPCVERKSIGVYAMIQPVTGELIRIIILKTSKKQTKVVWHYLLWSRFLILKTF